jgi:hypothetical protein
MSGSRGLQFFCTSPTFPLPRICNAQAYDSRRACRLPQTPPHPTPSVGPPLSLPPNSFTHPPLFFERHLPSTTVRQAPAYSSAETGITSRGSRTPCSSIRTIFSADRYFDPEPSFPLLHQLPNSALCCRGSLAPAASCFEFPLGLSAVNRLRLKGVWAADLQQVPCPSRELPREPGKPPHSNLLVQHEKLIITVHLATVPRRCLSPPSALPSLPTVGSPIRPAPGVPAVANRLPIADPHTGSTCKASSWTSVPLSGRQSSGLSSCHRRYAA